jgi:hypothetical protein
MLRLFDLFKDIFDNERECKEPLDYRTYSVIRRLNFCCLVSSVRLALRLLSRLDSVSMLY